MLLGIICSYFQAVGAAKTLLNCECGNANPSYGNRIIGGVDTGPHEYPWMAGIFDANDEIYCGGSIITNRYILSAGHCVHNIDPFALYVLLGLHDRIRRDGVRYDIKDVLLHPNFTAYPYHDTSDIALIKTSESIIFSEKISPICLPVGDRVYDGRAATIAGWGRMSFGGENSRYLKQTQLVVQPDILCKRSVLGSILELDTMMCAYARKLDACQGDSGGPLFLKTSDARFEQIGTISFGMGCGTENAPGIYSRITAFMPWIISATNDSEPCRNSGE